MATVTKPIALDESINTTENPSRNIADVLAEELKGIADAVKPSASDIPYDNTASGLNASDVQEAIDELSTVKGRTITSSGYTALCFGYITSSSKQIYFNIPVNGKGVTSVSFTGVLQVRSSAGGYVKDSNGTSLQNVSVNSVSLTLTSANESGVIMLMTNIDSSLSFIDAPNNGLVSVLIAGSATITFT